MATHVDMSNMSSIVLYWSPQQRDLLSVEASLE